MVAFFTVPSDATAPTPDSLTESVSAAALTHTLSASGGSPELPATVEVGTLLLAFLSIAASPRLGFSEEWWPVEIDRRGTVVYVVLATHATTTTPPDLVVSLSGATNRALAAHVYEFAPVDGVKVWPFAGTRATGDSTAPLSTALTPCIGEANYTFFTAAAIELGQVVETFPTGYTTEQIASGSGAGHVTIVSGYKTTTDTTTETPGAYGWASGVQFWRAGTVAVALGTPTPVAQHKVSHLFMTWPDLTAPDMDHNTATQIALTHSLVVENSLHVNRYVAAMRAVNPDLVLINNYDGCVNINESLPTSAVVSSGGTVTLTVPQVGDHIVADPTSYQILVAGLAPSGLNGTFTLTGATATTLAYALADVTVTDAVGTVKGVNAPLEFDELSYARTSDATGNDYILLDNGTDDDWMMDVTDSVWRAAVIDRCGYKIKPSTNVEFGVATALGDFIDAYDGCDFDGNFIDDMGAAGMLSVGYVTGVAAIPTGSEPTNWATEYTNATYLPESSAAVAAYRAGIRLTYPSAIVMPNGVGHGKLYLGSANTDLLFTTGNADLGFAETCVRNDGNGVTSFRNHTEAGAETADWISDVEMLVQATAAGHAIDFCVKLWVAHNDAQKLQWFTYAYATFLLGAAATGQTTEASGHKFAFYPSQYPVNVGGDKPDRFEGAFYYNPDYESRSLGVAREDYDEVDGAYIRRFANGIVVVNPDLANDNGTLTDIPLGGHYYAPEAPYTAVTTVTLAANTAAILFNRGDTLHYPTSDVSKVGAWANELAATTNLYQSVDEAVTDDADYVTVHLEGTGIIPGQVGSPVSATTALGTPYTYRQMMFGDVSHYHAGLLLIPDDYSFLVEAPLVFHVHGVTGTETQILDAGWEDFVNLCMDAGWAIIALRGGITVNLDGTDENDGKWGNQACRDAFTDIMGWVDANMTVPAEGPGFVSYSAGATHVVNYAMQAEDDGYPVAAMAMSDPAISIRGYYNEGGTSGRSKIRAAYGLSTPLTVGDAQWVAAIDTADNGHDPCIVAMSEIPDVPIYMSASYADTTVTREEHADVFKARLDAVPWTSATDLVETFGNHGNANNINGQEMFDWIEAAYA